MERPRKVAVSGATGFIGRAICRKLAARGHEVLPLSRRAADFADPASLRGLIPVLAGVEVLVNAAGIFRERRGQRFAELHADGPRMLFASAREAGVRRIVQVSALGADAGATSRFHLTKRLGDEAAMGSGMEWAIVQPSVVFGRGGRSARQLAVMASLPVIPLPGGGDQRIQPIHVDDLAELVCGLVEAAAPLGVRIAAVGPRAVTMGEWLRILRRQLGGGEPRVLHVPRPVVSMVIGAEALGMLERGNTEDPSEATRRLGRMPRPVESFIEGEGASQLALQARLAWTALLLEVSLALVWLIAGVVSLGLYPVEESIALLGRVGLEGGLAKVSLYGAALLDLLLGVSILAWPRSRRQGRRWLWRAQALLVVGYSAILTSFMPELWLHPFGPLAKNLPILAALALLHEIEEHRWNI